MKLGCALISSILLSSCGGQINTGVIFQKKYTPESSYWTTQFMYDGNGQISGSYPVYNYVPEEFRLVVRGELNGHPVIREFCVDSHVYHQAALGMIYDRISDSVKTPVTTIESKP